MTNARLEELRSKFQENPRRYFAPYANELRKAGDPAQAITVCRTHLATQPGHVSGHIVLGQALYEAGDAQEARDTFTTALELDPENLIALRTLGEISQVNGEFVSARQWYERLLEADPRNAEVAQLLRDLPTENARRESPPAPVQAHAAETSLEEHQEQERSPYAPPAPPPSFHSGFTGPGPAYQTAEDLAEEERKAPAAAEPAAVQPVERAAVDEPVEFVDMASDPIEMESAAPEPIMSDSAPESGADWSMAAVHDSEAPIEMVDFDTYNSDPLADEGASMDLPDESHEPVAESTGLTDFGFASPTAASGTAIEEAQPAAEFEVPVDDATEEFEQPRALFAERGFDGPAGDQIGWVMTPSAVESDLESAPEDWFDAPAAEQAHEEAAERPVDEREPVIASESEHSTDSWFDEAPGASVVVPTEGLTADDFWLPPDLSQVRTSTVAETQEPEAEPFAETASAEGYAADEQNIGEHYVAEPTAEVPVAETTAVEAFETAHEEFETAAEHFTSDAASASVASPTTESEPLESADISAIEYFDHSSSVTEVHADVADDRWSDPIAQAEPGAAEPEQSDQYVQPIAEQHAAPESTWESAAAAAAYVESTESAEPAPAMEASPSAESDEFAMASAAPDESGVPEPVVGHSPPMAESTTQATPEPFITETLADLYFQQGFRDEALSIYRQLVEREPSNVALRQRMEAIEQGESRQPAARSEAEASDRAASQSVRTFFSKLARRPAVGSSQGAQAAADPAQPDVPFASAASALANLFAASKPAASDEGAAGTLAGAYTNPTGRPSRAADRELSLDHLFRDVPPGGSQAGGMSMDEFYSAPDAASGSPTEPDEAVESPESGGTDIRQFTAWLEGLRKK